MKKILSTFLLSAMLVLVLGGCESEEKIAADSKEQKQIERLERQVEALMFEVRWLHYCARIGHEHSNLYNAHQMQYHYHSGIDGCSGGPSKGGGLYYHPQSPFKSREAFNAWEKKDYP